MAKKDWWPTRPPEEGHRVHLADGSQGVVEEAYPETMGAFVRRDNGYRGAVIASHGEWAHAEEAPPPPAPTTRGPFHVYQGEGQPQTSPFRDVDPADQRRRMKNLMKTSSPPINRSQFKES